MKDITARPSRSAKGTFNHIVTLAMIILTAYGSFQNGWLNLANLTSWLGLVGTVGLAHKWQGNFYFNGFQNAIAAIVAGRAKLFGDMFMSLFYLSSQVYGYTNWSKHRTAEGLQVESRSNWFVVALSILVGFFLLGGVSWLMGGAFILLDAFNNSTAIVAQVMQMRRNRNSWLLWLLTNLVGIYIWLGVGVPQMAIMYAVFALNSVRGFINWSE